MTSPSVPTSAPGPSWPARSSVASHRKSWSSRPRTGSGSSRSTPRKTSRGSSEPTPRPASSPFIRGPRATMYANRPWTLRQYAGFSTAEESNAFYKAEPGGRPAGAVGGLRPRHPPGLRLGPPPGHRRRGQGGGRHRLRGGHEDPLRRDPPRPGHRVHDDERRGAAHPRLLRGGGRGAGRPPPRSSPAPSRTTSSRSSWSGTPTSTRPSPPCGSWPTSSSSRRSQMPKFNSISISGYHMQEAGATTVQELAFTIADGLEYVRAALGEGPRHRQVRRAPLLLLVHRYELLPGDRQDARRPPHLGRAHPEASSRRRTPRSMHAAHPLPDLREPASPSRTR